MAKIGEALTAPETGYKRFDDVDANLSYDGATAHSRERGCYAGTFTHVDGGVKFNFTGTKFRLIGDHYNNKTTSADIFIDGTKVANFNQYLAVLIYQSLECDITGLENKEHYVSIVNNTNVAICIDAIDIDETGELKPYNPNSTPVISAPTNLTATAGDAKVTFNWNAVTGATGYNVKRSTTAGGPYTTIGSNVSGNSYVDSGLTNGTTYYYVVTAITANGESGNSNEASATPQATVTPPSTETQLLRVTMIDSSEREYRLPKSEIDGFINWINHHTSTDTLSYTLNKTGSKENLIFDKIISFEVMTFK